MSAYEIKVSVTPLCPSCGKECHPGSFMTESRPSKAIFDRDNPYERTDRRVFIAPCADCFVHRAEVAELIEAVDRLTDSASSMNDGWDEAVAALARVKGA